MRDDRHLADRTPQGELDIMKFRTLLVCAPILIATMVWNSSIARAAVGSIPFEGEKSTWHDGFDRYDFVMDESSLAITPFRRAEGEGFGVKVPEKGRRRCIVVVPKQAAPGNPWSWRGCYWDHEPQTEVELLRRGFHVAFITPDPGPQWEAWCAYLTEKHGLSKTPAFVGMSKGGVNAYEWSVAHPDKVSCIYADNPAIRPGDFAKLGELAKHDVALLNVCGSQDFLLERHTLAIEDRYHQLGGRITVMIKDGPAHHPHSLRDPKPIADWIDEHCRSVATRPDFTDGTFTKSYYYSLDSTYHPLKEEQTFATCRGPGFSECFDRYDATTDSQWGLTGMAVIVPKSAAPGKPWVFRAASIGRDAAVDQALLARGFHIVVAPLTTQSGAVRTQWDATYKRMVDHGFSKKPVMEGAGTAAGEAYAWAIENPEKVSCVYAENPALRSLMSKAQPLEHLDSLAKAGVPLIHVCGSLDPWLESQTRIAETRYKQLGGQIRVIIDEGKAHLPTGPRDPKPVVDFILAQQKSPAT
jgi:pimeloyl-ACP methyl ester carboxylesterase